jgi:Rad52/22 family double-strand break repair protein
MNREILEKPFTPEQIKQRQGTNGDVLDYIEGCAVIQRLNECFDAEWIFEIQEHRVYDDEVVVLGKLTAQGVTKSQFGKSRITRAKKDNSIISLGDDLKAAATDCLKKCATLFGVGLHLYFDVSPVGNGNTNGRANGNIPGNGNGEHRSNGIHGAEGNGSESGRLTARQLSAIFAMAKARGWSNKQVRDFSQEMFGKLPDFLNKREASAVIQHLQGGHND